jgi:hypothetical protein
MDEKKAPLSRFRHYAWPSIRDCGVNGLGVSTPEVGNVQVIYLLALEQIICFEKLSISLPLFFGCACVNYGQ